jgi:hypothetical protein
MSDISIQSTIGSTAPPQQAKPPSVPAPPTPRNNNYGLSLLSDDRCLDDSRDLIGVDIVAIHGLNGDAYSTWKHENGTMWLKDLLPSALPGSRIFTFGYPAELFWSKSVASLRDYSHSLLSSLLAVSEENVPRPISQQPQ